ncbi:MAG: hypothetical protein AAGI52_14900 [Bacteroidota bacterium]
MFLGKIGPESNVGQKMKCLLHPRHRRGYANAGGIALCGRREEETERPNLGCNGGCRTPSGTIVEKLCHQDGEPFKTLGIVERAHFHD